jgi:hypothetical protein
MLACWCQMMILDVRWDQTNIWHSAKLPSSGNPECDPDQLTNSMTRAPAMITNALCSSYIVLYTNISYWYRCYTNLSITNARVERT